MCGDATGLEMRTAQVMLGEREGMARALMKVKAEEVRKEARDEHQVCRMCA